ncbi:DUF1758 domain-containing protein [Trichonephila clavipes]|nr:DUF1758 domain-containing protein [Trichonephila clavipes]
MLPVLGKKAVLEWRMKEGLIGSSYVCPKYVKSMELRERKVKNHTVGERGIETNSNPTRFEGQPEVAVLTYGNQCVLLNTFMIFVKRADGYRIKLRGLLDNASTICVMREDIARKFGFKFRSANQSITGINGITQSSKYSANIEVSNRYYTFALVKLTLLPKITDAIPVSKLNISDLNIPALQLSWQILISICQVK